MVITSAQLDSNKKPPELRFCWGWNRAHNTLEIWNDENLWLWSPLEIRLNTFLRSTIPQNFFWQFDSISFRVISIFHHFCQWIHLLCNATWKYNTQFASLPRAAKNIIYSIAVPLVPRFHPRTAASIDHWEPKIFFFSKPAFDKIF